MNASTEAPSFETLALERAGEHVTVVRLNRPDASNALNTQMGQDLVRYYGTSHSTPKTCAAWS
jgi:enoyl-CoA hydratase